MRKFRRLIRLLVFLAIVLYIAAHLAIRTERGRAWAEARLSEKTGLDVSAEAIRFTAGLGYRLTNVKASFRDAAGTEREVFAAPQALVTRGCHDGAWFTWFKASRAVLHVTQDATGAWTPAFGTRFAPEKPEAFFQAASTSFGALFFALEDATITVTAADGSTVSYYGVSWKNFSVHLHGNDKIREQFLRQGLLQVQCYVETPAGGVATTHSGTPIAIDQNWLVLNDGTTFDLTGKDVADREPAQPNPESPAPAPETTEAETRTPEPEAESPAPEPETRNAQPETAKPAPTPEPETRNPEPETESPAPAPEPETRNPEPETAPPAPTPESK